MKLLKRGRDVEPLGRFACRSIRSRVVYQLAHALITNTPKTAAATRPTLTVRNP